jgi:hypothetical protein
MKRAIKDHWRDFAAILGLLLIAGAVSAIILSNQRFRFPFIQDKPLRLYAELDNAQAGRQDRPDRQRRAARRPCRRRPRHLPRVQGRRPLRGCFRAAAPAHRPQGHVPPGRPG